MKAIPKSWKNFLEIISFVNFLLALLIISVAFFLIGYRFGKKQCNTEYAQKFPTVQNLQLSTYKPKIGDISIYGSEANPCNTQPCVSMWNGKSWVELIPNQ